MIKASLMLLSTRYIDDEYNIFLTSISAPREDVIVTAIQLLLCARKGVTIYLISLKRDAIL